MIKLAICDDEIEAIQLLSEKIKSFMEERNLEYTQSKFLSGEELLSHISIHNEYYDVVFLDIRMSQVDGLDTARIIRKTNEKMAIVFVTVLKDYVFDAFDVAASNYLLKPISQEKLVMTLEKVIAAIDGNEEEFLIVHRRGTVNKILLKDILYCEAIDHRVFIYQKSNTIEYGKKIDELEKQLPSCFFRCHRSYLVSLRHVDSYHDGFASLPSGEKIPIATRRQQEFMKGLLRYQREEVR